MMEPLTTTLAAIRAKSPCSEGWTKLLGALGKTQSDDEPLLFETILDSNGIDDALWCLRALGHEHQRTCRLFAIWCARQVQHLMTDPRSLAALDVAECHANGEATDDDLAAAWDAARDADLAAARDAARAAAWDAAWAAARAAAWAAARAAAWDAAWAVTRDAQSVKFREICRAGEWVE